MENIPSENQFENDRATHLDNHAGVVAVAPNEEKREGAKLFVDRLTEFFKNEIPRRFALGKWDPFIVLLVAGGVLVWVLVFGWFRSHQGVLGRPLKVGIVSWPGYAGGLVANNGLYRNTDSEFWQNDNKLLVDFKIIDDNAELYRQFRLGGDNDGIDVMWSTVDSLAIQIPQFEKEGIHLKAFMQVDWSRGGDAIVVGQNVRSVADLKGLKVARSLSASQWLLEHTLETDSSLTEEEKKAIIGNLGPETGGSVNAREDFQSGRADAAVLWEPDVYDLTENEKTRKVGAHVLVDTSANMASNLIADVMVARQEFIQDARGRLAIKAFIKGWFKGAERAKNDPSRAVKVLKEEASFAKRENNVVRGLLDKVSLSTLDDNVRMFGLNGGRRTFDELFDQASRVWLRRKFIDKEFAATKAYDVELLKEIEREVGIAKPTGCESPRLTKTLLVDFKGQVGISEEITNKLDSEEVAQLFRTYPETRFCVQSSGETGKAGKDYDLLIDTSRRRTTAIIDYLSKHYNRRPGDVIPDVTLSELANARTSSAYIRITVVGRNADSP